MNSEKVQPMDFDHDYGTEEGWFDCSGSKGILSYGIPLNEFSPLPAEVGKNRICADRPEKCDSRFDQTCQDKVYAGEDADISIAVFPRQPLLLPIRPVSDKDSDTFLRRGPVGAWYSTLDCDLCARNPRTCSESPVHGHFPQGGCSGPYDP